MGHGGFRKPNLVTVFYCVFLSTFGGCKVIKDKTTDDSVSSSDNYGSGTVLNNLTTFLFENYGPNVRPVCPGQEKVDVTVDMAVRQLINLDEPAQTVEFNIWMRLGWRDCQLVWDPDEYNGTNSLVVPIDMVWKPDITLYSSISEEFYGFNDFRATIYYDGHVSYNFPTKIESLCAISVAKFPYDSQMCPFMFGSWSYNGFELDVRSKINAADLSSVKEHVEWIIEKAPAVRHEVYYGCCPEPYPDVTFYIHLKRKPDYYETNIIVPSFLITLIAALGFLLPVDAGEKVGLELTVMLAMSVFQLLIADHLPPSADETPWISTFFSFTLVLSGAASFWQVIVLNIHHRGDRKMPFFLKFYLLKPIGMVTFISLPRVKTPYVEKKTVSKPDKNIARLFNNLDQNRRAKEAESGIHESEETPEIDDSDLWVRFALMLDRIGLVLFVLSFGFGSAYVFMGIQTS